MRIVVDLQCCQNASRVRGIGRYALAMTRALATMGSGHEWLVLLSDRFPESIGGVRAAFADILVPDAIKVCALPGQIAAAEPANAWRSRAAQIVRAEYLSTLAPNIVFVPSFFEGLRDDVAVSLDPSSHYNVVTLHDLIPLEDPWRYLPTAEDEVAYLRRAHELRRADLMLPISSYTARRAADLIRLDAGRMVVVPNGVEPQFAPSQAGGGVDLLSRFGLTRPFVLNTSPVEHRKNVEGLISAFAGMPPGVRDRHQLLLVGRIDEGGRHYVTTLAQAAGLPADALVLAGYVDDRELIALYGQCAVFVFPSFSEGFGLPPLEAMACGAPVIASGTTSLPEVIGREEALFDPDRPSEIGAMMERVLTDAAWRATLIAHGLERARSFTWEESARIALAAFERLGEYPQDRRHATPRRAPRIALFLCGRGSDDMLRGKAAVLAPLLAATAQVEVIGGGDAPDLALDAVAERRTVEWFDAHAALMDVTLYLTAGPMDEDADRRRQVHPGPVIQIRPWWLGEEAVWSVADATGEALPVLPIAVALDAAREWRIECRIAHDEPLIVAFADRKTAPLIRHRLQSTGVRLHVVDDVLKVGGDRYRVLVTVADALLTCGSLHPGLLAQLRADARNLGTPLVQRAEQHDDLFEALVDQRLLLRTHPIAADSAKLTAWSDALAQVIDAAAATPRPLLTRVARRLPAIVRGIAPSSDDLAQMAIGLAANSGERRSADLLFYEQGTLEDFGLQSPAP